MSVLRAALLPLCVLTFPGAAVAATVTTTDVQAPIGHTTEAVYRQVVVAGEPGEASALRITLSGAEVTVHDAAAPVRAAGAHCRQADPGTVVCSDVGSLFPGGGSYPDVTVDAGDGDDVVEVAGAGRALLTGGAGDDRLSGGDGADELRPGAGRDTLLGGAGDDTFPLGTADGGDTLDGGAGRDTLTAGPAALDADLAAGTLTAGAAADRLAAIEVVRGGRGADVLRGTDGPDVLDGGGGADRLDGRGGDDVLDAGVSVDAADPLDLYADLVEVPDGARDALRCGAGADVVVRPGSEDALDTCERVDGPAVVATRPLRRGPRAVALRVTTRADAGPVRVELVRGTGRRTVVLGRSALLSGARTRAVTIRLRAAGRRVAALPGRRAVLVRVVDVSREDPSARDRAAFRLSL